MTIQSVRAVSFADLAIRTVVDGITRWKWVDDEGGPLLDMAERALLGAGEDPDVQRLRAVLSLLRGEWADAAHQFTRLLSDETVACRAYAYLAHVLSGGEGPAVSLGDLAARFAAGEEVAVREVARVGRAAYEASVLTGSGDVVEGAFEQFVRELGYSSISALEETLALHHDSGEDLVAGLILGDRDAFSALMAKADRDSDEFLWGWAAKFIALHETKGSPWEGSEAEFLARAHALGNVWATLRIGLDMQVGWPNEWPEELQEDVRLVLTSLGLDPQSVKTDLILDDFRRFLVAMHLKNVLDQDDNEEAALGVVRFFTNASDVTAPLTPILSEVLEKEAEGFSESWQRIGAFLATPYCRMLGNADDVTELVGSVTYPLAVAECVNADADENAIPISESEFARRVCEAIELNLDAFSIIHNRTVRILCEVDEDETLVLQARFYRSPDGTESCRLWSDQLMLMPADCTAPWTLRPQDDVDVTQAAAPWSAGEDIGMFTLMHRLSEALFRLGEYGPATDEMSSPYWDHWSEAVTLGSALGRRALLGAAPPTLLPAPWIAFRAEPLVVSGGAVIPASSAGALQFGYTLTDRLAGPHLKTALSGAQACLTAIQEALCGAWSASEELLLEFVWGIPSAVAYKYLHALEEVHDVSSFEPRAIGYSPDEVRLTDLPVILDVRAQQLYADGVWTAMYILDAAAAVGSGNSLATMTWWLIAEGKSETALRAFDLYIDRVTTWTEMLLQSDNAAEMMLIHLWQVGNCYSNAGLACHMLGQVELRDKYWHEAARRKQYEAAMYTLALRTMGGEQVSVRDVDDVLSTALTPEGEQPTRDDVLAVADEVDRWEHPEAAALAGGLRELCQLTG